MAIIKTAILQTHVYEEKSSAVPTRINTFRSMRKPKVGTPGKNVPGWQQNVEFIL